MDSVHNIPIIDRPKDFKIWFCGGHKNFTPRDLRTFVASMKKWWSSIQPVDRARDAHGLFKHDSEDIDWSRLHRAGRNGMYLVVVGLMWWREGLENDMGLDAWFVMVEDVTWVLVRLVATHQIERYGNLGACAKSSDPRGFQRLYNQPKNSPSNAREISLSLGAL
jgi:hypothetical protein